MSAALIFGLLFALMLTGMPISISLGLTVLTFLFTMTEVPIESVGLKLFSGLDNFGIVPGIMLASMLAVVTWFIAWRNGYPRMQRATFREQWSAFRESVWGLLLIVIVLGGIYGGIFTLTEAAAVAAVYAFFITVFVYKELKLREVSKVLLLAASMRSMLLYIITNAVLFSFLMTHEQIPQEMAAWIIDKNFSIC